MEISQSGIEFIMQMEQFRAALYSDIGGHPTIGYGHLAYGYPDKTITQEKAKALLMDDLKHSVSEVNKWVKVPLTQHQFDALVDFEFNTGAISNSSLQRELNLGHYCHVACYEFSKWVYCNSIKINGLIKRRQLESKLFLTAD